MMMLNARHTMQEKHLTYFFMRGPEKLERMESSRWESVRMAKLHPKSTLQMTR